MKIKYEFINGESTEIEIEENIGAFILDSRKEEATRSKMEQRHCYSSDAAIFEGNDYASNNTPEKILITAFENKRIQNVLTKLSEVQRRRLLMYAEGLSMREIARLEGTHHSAVSKSIEGARKNFLKFF